MDGQRWNSSWETSLLSFPAHKACKSSGPCCVCVRARTLTRARGLGLGWDSLATLPVSIQSEEWSVCFLSTVIKGKEIFHWVLGDGLYKCAAGGRSRAGEAAEVGRGAAGGPGLA